MTDITVLVCASRSATDREPNGYGAMHSARPWRIGAR